MIYIYLFLGLGILGFLSGKLIKHKSLYPFMPFRYDFRKRRDSFKLAMELLDRTNAKIIIETGTSREGLKGAKSNGAATIVFGKWASNNNAVIHSIDISEVSIEASRKEVLKQGLDNYVHLHTSDSVAFLKIFKQKVDFLYLDSYDYSDNLEEQKKSQIHHLNEFIAIENQLHENSLVLIDDCDLPNGGKGKLVVEYMLQNKWKIIKKTYQIMLVNVDFPF